MRRKKKTKNSTSLSLSLFLSVYLVVQQLQNQTHTTPQEGLARFNMVVVQGSFTDPPNNSKKWYSLSLSPSQTTNELLFAF